MSRDEELCSEALALGQTLVQKYFQVFMGSREEIVHFYGFNATLSWNDIESRGKTEIMQFVQGLPELSFQVASYEVQAVPATNLWAMLVVTGTVQGPGHLCDFHSSFFVELQPDEKKAVIRFHTFQCLDL